MQQGGQQDPERRGFDVVRSHSPRSRLSAGRAAQSRLPCGAQKARGLDRAALPAKNTNVLRRGNGSSVWAVVGAAKGERNLRFLSPLESPFFPTAPRNLRLTDAAFS
jgi:hypothetical protein